MARPRVPQCRPSSAPESATDGEQRRLSASVGGLYRLAAASLPDEGNIQLRRREHVAYLQRGLATMGPGYAVLDSSRPWLCYWILHSLALLGQPMTPDVRARCVDFLKRCQDSDGGYGGGPGQLPHLATTYAAVCALVTVGGAKALDSMDRPRLLAFLLRMKAACGGYHMHADGEVDVRGSYCALAVAHLLNLTNARLTAGVGAYVATCQTYEGGIGGEPGVEAHGGYTFCGLAAALLAGDASLLRLPALAAWLVARQGAVEGGFQGRTNKLVDGCYAFWQGATGSLLQRLTPQLVAQQRALYGGTPWKDSHGRNKDGNEATSESGTGAKDVVSEHELGGSTERDRSDAGRMGQQEREAETRDGSDERGEGRMPGSRETERRTAADLPERSANAEAVSAAAHDRAEQVHGEAERIMPAGTHSDAGNGARGTDPGSNDSSEYETDEDMEGPLSGSIRMAAELFPAEPLPELDAQCAGPHLVIEEEGGVGPSMETGQRAEGEGGEGGGGSANWGGQGGLGEVLVNARALQAYILVCCQEADGGLRDKPGKARDYYHTCYCLSGLTAAQWSHVASLEDLPQPRHVLGPYSNLLEPADPVCNVHAERYAEVRAHFATRPLMAAGEEG